VVEFIYGRNAVYETLRAKRRELLGLQVADGVKPAGRIEEIMKLAALAKVPAKLVPRAKLDTLGANHQGVALEAGEYPYSSLIEILELARQKKEQPFVLLIDALQDPQNFGTLLRTAEACGVHGVIIPLARAVGVTPAGVNASSGASEHLLIAQSNLSQAMDSLKEGDAWLIGLDPKGEALGPKADRHLEGALGLVVGSEGGGLHELTRKKCDLVLSLPMRGQVESLNAAVAGSVVLYLAYLARERKSR
jgi:23S rRNA (guanosine2251-2'-O)-methyltransferase